jgi:hypothetical protein
LTWFDEKICCLSGKKITLTRQTVTDHVRLCKRNKLFQIGTEIGIIDEAERVLSLKITYEEK